MNDENQLDFELSRRTAERRNIATRAPEYVGTDGQTQFTAATGAARAAAFLNN